jgi:hypothetical protein
MWRLTPVVLACFYAAPAAASTALDAISCPAIPLVGESTDNMRTRAPLPLRNLQRTASYRIDATLDPDKHTISGRESVSWRNRSDVPVCTLYLHVDLNAFEGYDSRYMTLQRMRGIEPDVPRGEWGHGELLRVQQGGEEAPWIYVQPDGSPPADRSVVRLDLPQPVAPGETAELDIDFAGRLPGSWAETGYAGTFHLAAGWFPQIATLQLPGEEGAASLQWNARAYAGDRADREPADFDVHIRAPRDYSIASTGEPRGVLWSQRDSDNHFIQQDTRTFAWAADARFVQPLEYEYSPPNGQPVTLRVLYRLGDAAAAVNSLGTMIDALSYYSASLGGYPESTLTAVIGPRNAGQLSGQFFPSLFTAGKQAGAARERADVTQAALAAIGSAYFTEGTDAVFRAGVRRYWAERFQHFRNDGMRLAVHGGWAQRLLEPWRLAFMAERRKALTRMDADALRADHIARVLHDLETRIGAIAMDQAFRSWRRGVRAGYPDTSQTRWLLGEGSGHADEFERAFAMIDAGIAADDRVLRFSSEELRPRDGYGRRDGAHAEAVPRGASGKQPRAYRTVVVAQRSGIAVPQTLTVTFADGSTHSEQWNDTRTLAHFEWTTRARAVSAQIDPQRHVLLDRNKFDDGRTIAADLRPVRRWWGEIAAMVQAVASWLVLL